MYALATLVAHSAAYEHIAFFYHVIDALVVGRGAIVRSHLRPEAHVYDSAHSLILRIGSNLFNILEHLSLVERGRNHVEVGARSNAVVVYALHAASRCDVRDVCGVAVSSDSITA